MKKYKTVTQFFEQKSPADVDCFVTNNLAITEQVAAILAKKSWTQKDLAKAVGKSDAEISKWLSGTHNLTLRSISKLEAALGVDLIMTPMEARRKYKRIEYIPILLQAKPNHTQVNHNKYKKIASPELIPVQRQKVAVA